MNNPDIVANKPKIVVGRGFHTFDNGPPTYGENTPLTLANMDPQPSPTFLTTVGNSSTEYI